ncbi:MAG TPA: hypothetical protein VL137_14690, partial [Polyangiaceae bacterium]|nr:hypothetical protein [Polyangiaceae bacterium]
SQKRLRELAQRSQRIVERHKGLDVNTAGLGETLTPAAQAYIDAYDAGVNKAAALDLAMAKGRASVADLNQRIRSCLVLVRRAVPEYDLAQIDGTVDRPDRLIANATQIVALLTQAGDGVRQSQSVIEALQQAVLKAEEQWAQAQVARVELQKAQGLTREHALVFHRELVTLRGVLRALLGTHHFDYQMLRTSRVIKGAAIEDDGAQEVVEAPTDSASHGVASDVASGVSTNGASTNGASTNSASTSGAPSNGVLMNGAGVGVATGVTA